MTKRIFLALPFAAAITACRNLEETTGTTSAAARIATSGVSPASTGTFRTHNSPMTLVQNGKVSLFNNEVTNVKANPLSAVGQIWACQG